MFAVQKVQEKIDFDKIQKLMTKGELNPCYLDDIEVAPDKLLALEPVKLSNNLYFFGHPSYGILYDHETRHLFHGTFFAGWARGQLIGNLSV